MKSFAQSLLDLWRQLGLNQRVSLALATLAVIAVALGLVVWSSQPDYQLLYGRLSDKDASAIITTLQAQNIPHKVSAGGGTIYVPAAQVHRLRMELAGKGVPNGDGVGFEIFDKGQFGLSDFVQRTNYTRAIQGELARTISQLDGVVHARVMIVQPENRLLITDQGVKPTASVFIELSSNRIDPEAVNSIRHLVANSVQGLTVDEVAVIDQRGRVLSAELKEDPMLGNASSLIRYRQQVEEYFSRKVESMLLPVVGNGNAIVRVSAEIDNEAATLTEEKFDPASAVIRSQTNTEDTTNSTETRKGGTVGVAANTPEKPAAPAADAAPVTTNEQSRKNHVTSYEINRTLSNVKRNPGGIKSLTAAVFVSSRAPAAGGAPVARTPAELDGLRRIVINALGLKAAAGQSLDELVSLQETPFQSSAVEERIEKIATETRVQGWIEGATRYIAVAIALGAFFLFYRMLRNQRPEPVPVELLKAGANHGANNGTGPVTFTPDMLNELIRQKPANVGTALRDWVGSSKN